MGREITMLKSTMLRPLLLIAAVGSSLAFSGMPMTMRPAVTARGSCVSMMAEDAVRKANPALKVASAGMGLIKPIFAAEAKLQGQLLGAIAQVSMDDVVAEIEEAKAQNPCLIYTYKLSPFSTEALALLDASGYEYTNIELGLEWFVLGGRGSQTRVALAGMCDNGASSLPKIFIGGKPLGGASGFSASQRSNPTDSWGPCSRQLEHRKSKRI